MRCALLSNLLGAKVFAFTICDISAELRLPVETMNHLGHSTITASLRYQHVVSGRDVEIANQLSALAIKPKLAAVADGPAESVQSA